MKQPKWKTVRARYTRMSRELKQEVEAANPTPAPIVHDWSETCQTCRTRGVKQNCPRCAKIREMREAVRIALQAEV